MYDFIAIDFEIANNAMDSACSIGLAAVQKHNIVKKDYFLIKPPILNFSPDTVSIHGITCDQVKNAKTFGELWSDISYYFTNSYFVIAHNAQFDMSVLHACLNSYNIPSCDFPYIDSIAISHRASKTTFSGNSLLAVAEHYGISVCDHHNALCDAETVCKVIIEVMKQNNVPNFIWLSSKYNFDSKMFSSLTPYKSFPTKKKSPYQKVSAKDIISATTNFDCTHPVYGKSFVFTGELQSMDRKSAMQKVVDLGGIIKNTVSKKIDFLVVGAQDTKIVGDDGLSNKEEKAYDLINNGVNITILKEQDFLQVIQTSNIRESAEQLSLFSPTNYLTQLEKLLTEITIQEELPENSLLLYSNMSAKGKNAGQEMSKSICIYEPPFPPGSAPKKDSGRNYVVMNLQEKNDGQTLELLIRKRQFEDLDCPESAVVKEVKSDLSFTHVLFNTLDSNMYDYISNNIFYCLANYESSSSFGCCNRFMECSDAKRCVHENKLYSMGCKYRKLNLDQGRIFYGKNRNV